MPPAPVHDLGAEHVAAEARVLGRLLAAQLVIHVQRRDAVTERAEGVPETGRVGAAGDECEHLAAGRNQLMRANVLLDPRSQLLVHRHSLAAARGVRATA